MRTKGKLEIVEQNWESLRKVEKIKECRELLRKIERSWESLGKLKKFAWSTSSVGIFISQSHISKVSTTSLTSIRTLGTIGIPGSDKSREMQFIKWKKCDWQIVFPTTIGQSPKYKPLHILFPLFLKTETYLVQNGKKYYCTKISTIGEINTKMFHWRDYADCLISCITL